MGSIFGGSSGGGGSSLYPLCETTFNEVSSILKNTETDIVAYTVPFGKTATVLAGSGEGKVDIIFKLYFETTLKEKKRNNWCERNVDFNSIVQAVAGERVKITAEHQNDDLQTISANLVYCET